MHDTDPLTGLTVTFRDGLPALNVKVYDPTPDDATLRDAASAYGEDPDDVCAVFHDLYGPASDLGGEIRVAETFVLNTYHVHARNRQALEAAAAEREASVDKWASLPTVHAPAGVTP